LTFGIESVILESTNKGIYQMSTELRNVPNLNTTTELTQTATEQAVRRAIAARLASELMSKLEFETV
jgi:hypothetical protein